MGFRIFAAVARAGSFTAAASGLGMSAVTAARRVASLEAELDLLLLVRGSRGVRLTSEGHALLEALDPWERAETDMRRRVAALTCGSASDPVRITGTEPIIAEIVAPCVPRFRHLHPDIRLDLRVSNEIASLENGEADIALRFARPVGDRLRVRRLASYRLGLYRARDLEGDWRDLPHVGLDPVLGRLPEMDWTEGAGVTPVVRTTSLRALLRMALAGVGTAILPDRIAREYPVLARLENAPAIPDRPLWLMTHPDASLRGQIRAAMDWLGESLRER